MLIWFLGGIVFNNRFNLSIHTSGLFLAGIVALLVYFYNYKFKKYSFGVGFSISFYVFAFLLGMFAYSVHYQPFYKNHYTNITINEEAQFVIAVVTERLKPSPKNEKYLVEITELNKRKTFGKLLLNAPKTATKPLKIGTKFIVYSKVAAITPPKNPNQFNYQKYLATQEVYKQIYLTKGNFKILDYHKNISYYIANFREKLIQSFDIHHFKPEVNHLMEALLFGQRQEVEAKTIEQFSKTGVMHVLAISGLHIGIVYLFLQGFLQLFLFFKKHPWVEFCLVMLFLWSFALLSGFSASVVRAVVMFTFFGLSKTLNKNYQTLNIWAVAMFLMLLFEPKYLFEVGFQLSFLAVFSIAWFLPLMQKIPTTNHSPINYFIDTLKITFAAQIGILPLSLYYFHQFPVLFFVANVLIIPLSTVVLIVGLLLIPFNFLLPQVALFIGIILNFFTNLMLWVVEYLSSFEFFTLQNITFSGTLVVLSYLFLAFVSYYFFTKKFVYIKLTFASLVIIQFVSFYENYNLRQSSEFIIFQDYSTTLVEKNQTNIAFYSSDSLAYKKTFVKDYLKDKPYVTHFLPLKNVFYFKHQKILVVDKSLPAEVLPEADILVLLHHKNQNLRKILEKCKPKTLVINGRNHQKYLEFIRKVAQPYQIIVYDIFEKGYFKIM